MFNMDPSFLRFTVLSFISNRAFASMAMASASGNPLGLFPAA
ncbi:hypothetical protein HD593_003262 [Nonomuraea rubra]|uniref:Uncharacterized protein n=1 Tax=Nonomuraea rubra TaxID=46180 RepID=A0A7X0NS06_9ACTN|nr:hypothetical protein [Nonomuraea rubra]